MLFILIEVNALLIKHLLQKIYMVAWRVSMYADISLRHAFQPISI